MILYYVTNIAEAKNILITGFEDSNRLLGRNRNGVPLYLAGVWLTDRPMYAGFPIDLSDLPMGWMCLSVDVPEELLLDEEDGSDDSPYREWCFSAQKINLLTEPTLTTESPSCASSYTRNEYSDSRPLVSLDR